MKRSLITTLLLLICLLPFSTLAQDLDHQDDIEAIIPNDEYEELENGVADGDIHPNEGPSNGEGHDFGDHSKCTHDHINFPEPELLEVDEPFPPTQSESESEGRVLSSASKFRIYPYYNFLAPAYYRTYFERRIGPAIISFFENALRVKYPITSRLKAPTSFKTICGKNVPSVLRSGVSADFFLMFDSKYDEGSGNVNWVAESYSCYLASGSKRPLIGKAVMNRAMLKDPGNNILLHEKNIYLMLHEITHALGFSSGLYKHFLDPNGRTRTGHITKVGAATVLNVPPLTNRLRSFFGCSTIRGAYMENSGSAATAGSHFERRHYPYEALTSGLIYQQAYTQFTLALLEGSGWYVPDYSYADPYWFGQGKGCNFLFGTCSARNFAEWCTGSTRSCTVMGRGGGICGSDLRSDGCRFVRSNVNYDCENPSARSYARLPSLQTFGRTANSKCFDGTLSASNGASMSSFCFKYTCTGSGVNTRVQVNVGTRTLTCSRKGTMSVSGYRGYINCPDPRQFCSTVGKRACPRGCMGRGRCVNGTCQCYKGFFGNDCAA